MLVYLMRHGEALSEQEDPSRGLTDRGEEKVGNQSDLLAHRFSVLPGHVFHSSKLRAMQTASIISKSLPTAPKPVETDGLEPMDDPEIWARRLETLDRDTLLVGHLPHLSRLASLLLIWDAGREILTFTPGTVVCLGKSRGWKVEWMINPEALKDPGV